MEERRNKLVMAFFIFLREDEAEERKLMAEERRAMRRAQADLEERRIKNRWSLAR